MEPRRMDIFSFIQKKLRIDDVEPMYTAIIRSKLPLKTRQKLCFAEGLADHLGLAARMAEANDFWGAACAYVAQGTRGGARRHFRGAVALDAIRTMERRFPDLSDFFRNMPDTFHEAREYIMDLPQFGPFSAFKIADMAERTCGVKVDFSDVRMTDFSKFPRRGADLALEYLCSTLDDMNQCWELASTQDLLDVLSRHKWCRLAPPHFDRPLNAQELETMFCNYGHSKWHEPGYEGSELKKLLEGYGKLASKISANIGLGRI